MRPIAEKVEICNERKTGSDTGPPRQATGPPRSGARVGFEMLRGAGDSLS